MVWQQTQARRKDLSGEIRRYLLVPLENIAIHGRIYKG
jgi:hypothetical protein